MLDVMSGSADRRGLRDGIARLQALYPGRSIALTDSGTSALRLAIEASHVARTTPRVAVPAFACPDLGTAALGARARLVLYDVDPRTLQPDLDSLRSALSHGASHVVVTHLFGRIADVQAVQAVMARDGQTLIEDAAQHAGGSFAARRGGGLADWSVLSFGRGKGLNCGGGGALLGPDGREVAADAFDTASRAGSARQLGVAAVTDVLSNPLAFGLVRRLPMTAVGETRYHPPHAPRRIAMGAGRLLAAALDAEHRELPARQQHERAYADALASSERIRAMQAHPSSVSGALRFPVLMDPGTGHALQSLGVARAYPRTLAEYPELLSITENPSAAMPGARELADRLHTLPTHALLTPADRERLVAALLSAPA